VKVTVWKVSVNWCNLYVELMNDWRGWVIPEVKKKHTQKNV